MTNSKIKFNETNISLTHMKKHHFHIYIVCTPKYGSKVCHPNLLNEKKNNYIHKVMSDDKSRDLSIYTIKIRVVRAHVESPSVNT